MTDPTTLLPDMTGLLIQYCQAHNLESSSVCNETDNHKLPDNPEHRCTVKVMANTVWAVGATKKIARKEASKSMLQALTGLDTEGEIVAYVRDLKGAGGGKKKGEGKKKAAGETAKKPATGATPVAAQNQNKDKDAAANLNPAVQGTTKGKKIPQIVAPTREHPTGTVIRVPDSGPRKCLSTVTPDEPEWATDKLKAVLKARKVAAPSQRITQQAGTVIVNLTCQVDGVKYETEFAHAEKPKAQGLASRDILIQLFPQNNTDQELEESASAYIETWIPLPQIPKADPNGPHTCVGGWGIAGFGPPTSPEIIYNSSPLNECEIDAEMPALLAQTCTMRYNAEPEYKVIEQGTGGNSKWVISVELPKYVPGLKGTGKASSQEIARAVAAEDLLRKFYPARTRVCVKQSVQLEAQCKQALADATAAKRASNAGGQGATGQGQGQAGGGKGKGKGKGKGRKGGKKKDGQGQGPKQGGPGGPGQMPTGPGGDEWDNFKFSGQAPDWSYDRAAGTAQ